MLFPRHITVSLSRQRIQHMRFNAMQHFDRSPVRWNPVVPSARHMDSRIELEYAIGKGIAAAKIIKEPAVDLSLTQSLLNLADTHI